MFAALARLLAVRPLLAAAIFGIPVIILMAVGLITIMALKFLVFVVLPIVVIVWVLRKLFWEEDAP